MPPRPARAIPGPVVFDLDGTLVDSAPDLATALNRVLAENDLPGMAEAAVRPMIGEGAARLIERGFEAAGRPLAGGLTDELRRDFLDHYADCLTDRTLPFPGVVQALEQLAAEGLRMAVCTNKPAAMSETILERLGLARYFDALLGGDSLPVRKPDPAPLLAAIAGTGAGAARAVLIGDSDTDVATARAAGVGVVAVSFGYTRVPARDLGADAVIDHFDELIPALAGLSRRRAAAAADRGS